MGEVGNVWCGDVSKGMRGDVGDVGDPDNVGSGESRTLMHCLFTSDTKKTVTTKLDN